MATAVRRHAAQKPLELVRELVRCAWRPGAVVLDPFAGAGTTLVAARELGVGAVGVELDGPMCEIARDRLRENGRAKAA